MLSGDVAPGADILPGWSQILRAAGNEVRLQVSRDPDGSRVANIALPGPDVRFDWQIHDLLALPLGHDRPGERKLSNYLVVELGGGAHLYLILAHSSSLESRKFVMVFLQFRPRAQGSSSHLSLSSSSSMS